MIATTIHDWLVGLCILGFMLALPPYLILLIAEEVRNSGGKVTHGDQFRAYFWVVMMGLLLWSLGPIPIAYLVITENQKESVLVVLALAVLGTTGVIVRRCSYEQLRAVKSRNDYRFNRIMALLLVALVVAVLLIVLS